MSHAHIVPLDTDALMESERINPLARVKLVLIAMVTAGALTLIFGMASYPHELVWGAYYTNLNFWMALAAGSVMISPMLQIVRARWGQPVRRLAEANVAFLPWAYVMFLYTYLGAEHLFPWGRGPMPGREWWMQPNFVYARFAILFALLFFMMWRYVRLSLRGDVGMLREQAKNKQRWSGWQYDGLVRNWKGTAHEVPAIQNKLSWNGPLLVAVYAIVYSLFSFEMLMGMDTIWYSTMFGGFIFVGNIYLAWAALTLLSVFVGARCPEVDREIRAQQRWDLGKLTFGWCMLWGYLFFAQFLPQWYGNLPEETQWMILRTREYPWMSWSWVCFSMCFVIPFIMLLSEDVKKVKSTLASIGLIIMVGIWLERYIIIMPQLSPEHVPFGILEVGIFFGFLGVYGLSVLRFLSQYPYMPISSPMSRGKTTW